MDPQFDDIPQDDLFGGGGGMGPDPFDSVFTAMPIFVGLFFVLFVAAIVFMVVTGTRKVRRYREAGIDPLTADVERDIRVMQALDNRRAVSAPRSSAPSLEERLDDLERLHRTGKITSAEREAARAMLLGSI